MYDGQKFLDTLMTEKRAFPRLGPSFKLLQLFAERNEPIPHLENDLNSLAVYAEIPVVRKIFPQNKPEYGNFFNFPLLGYVFYVCNINSDSFLFHAYIFTIYVKFVNLLNIIRVLLFL